jgi:hypothetical protein
MALANHCRNSQAKLIKLSNTQYCYQGVVVVTAIFETALHSGINSRYIA